MKNDVKKVMENFEQLIERLQYVNYCHNRHNAPEITPEQWQKVYGDKVEEFETLMKLEKEME